MPFTTYSLGLTLTIPTPGTRNWGSVMGSTTWTKISQHSHTGTGDGNQIGTAGLQNGAVTAAKLATNLGGNFAAVLTPAGDTQEINWNNGNEQRLSLASASDDVTLTFANPVAGAKYSVLITQGATPRDINWPANVKWPQAQKPIISVGNGDVDKVQLIYDGTNYYGDWNVSYA